MHRALFASIAMMVLLLQAGPASSRLPVSQQFSHVREFWAAIDKITIEARSPCGGSIMRTYYGQLNDNETSAIKEPWTKPEEGWNPLKFEELKRWAAYSTWNARYFGRLKVLFVAATKELAAHYRKEFPKGFADPEEMARKWLMQRTFFGLKGLPPAPGEMTSAILLDAPVADIRELLKSGWDGDPVVSTRYTGAAEPPLMAAVTRPDVLKLLLAHGVKPGNRNGFGKTALMAAAQYNNTESVAALIAAGADVNAQSLHPLEIPANRVNVKAWRMSLDHCSAYNIQYGQRTALMYAAGNGSLQLIKLLLKHGADPAVKDSGGHLPVDYLDGAIAGIVNEALNASERVEAGNLLEVDEATLAKKKRPAGKFERTALHEAAIKGSMSELKAEISKGVDVNAVDNQGWTALQYAIAGIDKRNSGSEEAALVLLDAKANPNPIYPSTPAPLALAIRERATKTIKRLLELGADASGDIGNIVDNSTGYYSYVQYALGSGLASIIPDLVASGAKADVPSYLVKQLTESVVRSGDWASIEIMLEKTNSHPIPKPVFLSLAVSNRQLDIVRKFLNLGADPNAPWQGVFPLMNSVIAGGNSTADPLVAAALIAAGADPTVKLSKGTAKGYTAHRLALARKQTEIAKHVDPRNARPGFDCAKARTLTERAICADPAASAADRAMSFLFGLFQRSAKGSYAAEQLVEGQREWLRQRAERCAPSDPKAADVLAKMAPCLVKETKQREWSLRLALTR
jgi:ankyrin repeat protein